MGIIYCARNKVNGKRYIGQTVQTLESRKYGHERALHSNKKRCSICFVNALRKYGVDTFEWTVMDEDVPDDQLDAFEIDAIAVYNTVTPNGYNILVGGSSGRRGLKHTEETRLKISIAGTGRKASEETKKKLSEAWKFREVTEAIKDGWKKVSLSKKGKKQSEMHRQNNAIAQTGRKASEETRKKMSESAKKKPLVSDESKRKMSEAGKNKSQETKRKMSISAKNRPPISEETRAKQRESARRNWEKKRLDKLSK